MFSSNNDALSHIDSHILSWKSLNIKKEELLSKINTILTEYTRRCYDVDHFCQYEFISIEKLLGYGTVYQSKIPSSALSELALCHQGKYANFLFPPLRLLHQRLLPHYALSTSFL